MVYHLIGKIDNNSSKMYDIFDAIESDFKACKACFNVNYEEYNMCIYKIMCLMNGESGDFSFYIGRISMRFIKKEVGMYDLHVSIKYSEECIHSTRWYNVKAISHDEYIKSEYHDFIDNKEEENKTMENNNHTESTSTFMLVYDDGKYTQAHTDLITCISKYDVNNSYDIASFIFERLQNNDVDPDTGRGHFIIGDSKLCVDIELISKVLRSYSITFSSPSDANARFKYVIKMDPVKVVECKCTTIKSTPDELNALCRDNFDEDAWRRICMSLNLTKRFYEPGSILKISLAPETTIGVATLGGKL